MYLFFYLIAENSACWFTIALHHQFLLGFKLQGPCKTKHWLSHWGWIHSFSFFEIKLTTSVPPVKPALLLIEIFPKIELSFYLHHSRHILHLHQSSYGQTILPQISKSSAPNTLSHECNSLFCLQRSLLFLQFLFIIKSSFQVMMEEKDAYYSVLHINELYDLSFQWLLLDALISLSGFSNCIKLAKCILFLYKPHLN